MNIKIWLAKTITQQDSKSGKIFEIIINSLIFISIIDFSIGTIPNLSSEFHIIIYYIELVTVIIFTFEYILRILIYDKPFKYIFSFFGCIDLLAFLPFYLASGLDFRSVRIFRFFRLLRIFKLFRYQKAMDRYRSAFLMIKTELTIFLTATISLIYLASVGIYYFENPVQPDKFFSVFECMWWSIITLTTIGYGDLYPITVGGKIFTSIIVIIGLGIIAIPTGLFASALTRTTQIENEKNKTSKL
jgi:voltage-gated potassium channel